jgi:hypothetical protein
MVKRTLFVVLLSIAAGYAADNPSPSASVAPAAGAASASPSEASIKQLLELAQARKLADSVMKQMDTLMLQTIEQATHGQAIPPKVQRDIDKRQAEVGALLKELLDWSKLEPIYVRIYQKTFTQPEVDGMIAFYKTPAGQAVVGKMPSAMQNTMEEMQQMMAPVMDKMQRMQQDVVAELKAESKSKRGG